MKPSLLVFDLDGTLIDSERDLINAVNAALTHLGREELHDDLVRSYVGDGAPVLMRRALGEEASEAEQQQALTYFLAHYREHMLENTTLYPGVRETLDEFRARGIPMAVLTNKPVRFSRDIVKGLGLGGHFFQVYGGNSFEQKKPHRVGIDRLLEESGAERAGAWMIGDSSTDILTAHNAGIRAAGVTYGFKPESLAEAHPDLLVESFAELPARLLG